MTRSRELKNLQAAEYRKRNKELCLQRTRDWRAKIRAEKQLLNPFAPPDPRTREERNRDHARASRARNPELARQKCKEWRAANSARVRAYNAEWRQLNLEKAKAAGAAWSAENPHKIAVYNQARKARLLQATTAWADVDLMDDVYALARIYRDHGVDCHVDHVVPLKSKLVCGLHTDGNLSVLLAGDNCSKGNRWWPDMPGSL